MAYWLLKTEPTCYAWADLSRDRKTVWDGITNALALKHLRTMQPDDLALIYHTGDERAAVGVAKITSRPYVDPNGDSEKLSVVDLQIVAPLAGAVTLDTIKADPAFAGWDLIRNSRLSVVPVPLKMWKRIEALSKMSLATGAKR